MSNYSGPDLMSAQLLEAYEVIASDYTNVATRLQAAEGDRDKALNHWVENSDDPQAVEIRDAIARATKRLQELAEEAVVSETLSESEKEALKTEASELKKKVRHSRDAILSVAETFGTDPEGVKTALNEIGDPTKSARGRTAGTTGSSLPRVSVNITVTGGNFDKPMQYDSFSKMANTINAGADEAVKELQLAFAAAAGVDHADISSVKEPVTFEFTPEGSTAVYTVATTPKARKSPKTDETVSTETVEGTPMTSETDSPVTV
jgi:hypothetical protein